jgi:hypothetical protein
MTRIYWIWSFVGFATIGALGFVIIATMQQAWPTIRLSPSFLEMQQPLTSDRYWILAGYPYSSLTS